MDLKTFLQSRNLSKLTMEFKFRTTAKCQNCNALSLPLKKCMTYNKKNFKNSRTIIDVCSIERTSQCATISNIATSQMIDHIVHSYSVDYYVHIILINTHIKEGTKKIVSNLAAKKQTFLVYAKIYKSFHFIKGTQHNRIVKRVRAIIISICVTGGREIDITKKNQKI